MILVCLIQWDLTFSWFYWFVVFLSILEVMFDGFKDDKYKPCSLLVEMVKNNNLGLKTGQGFYDYSEGPRNKKVASQFQ